MLNPNQQARAWVQEALALAGYPDLKIRVTWSSRMSRALGKAVVRRQLGLLEIRLSSRAWELLPADSWRSTVFHEVAHLVAREESGKMDHGPAWTAVMARIGYPDAERFASLEESAAVAVLRRPRTRHLAKCACDTHVHHLTSGQANKIRSGVCRFRCNTCSTFIALTGQIVKV